MRMCVKFALTVTLPIGFSVRGGRGSHLKKGNEILCEVVLRARAPIKENIRYRVIFNSS